MNENTKTIGFVGVAAVLLAIGVWLSIPSRPDERVELGQPFFPEFDVAIGDKNDVGAVTSAEIVEVSPDTSAKRTIKAERINDIWQVNPGRQLGYPELSVNRLKDVILSMRNLTKLDISSRSAEDHRRYGVVDPTDAETLKSGSDGVGKLVTFQSSTQGQLVKLIVGKKDEKNPALAYVRVPGNDAVYLAKFDPSPLSTRFEDWVNPDLLEEGSGVIRAVKIDDHAIDAEKVREIQGIFQVERSVAKPIFKSEAELKKDADDKWQLVDMQVFDKEKQQFAPRKLAEDEEIDTGKLFSLGRNLGQLRIVDAVKKAPILAEDLASAENFLTNPRSKVRSDERSIRDLQVHGFLPSTKAEGSQELTLINHEGDMTVGFEDGVSFTLRFGGITGRGQADAAKGGEEGKADAKPDAAAPAEGLDTGSNTAPSRYVMITATFDPDLVKKPKLEELPPEEPAKSPAKPEEKKADDAKPADKKPEEKKPDEKKPEEKKPEEAKPEPAKTESTKPAEPSKPADPAKQDDGAAGSCDDQEPEKKEAEKKEPANNESEKKEPEKKPAASSTSTKPASATPTATKPAAAASSSADKKPETTKPAEAKPAEAKPAGTAPEAKPAAAAPAATPSGTKPAEPKPLTPEQREQIKVNNKNAQTAYETKLKDGREKAERLNKKFAEWFYVVSATTYDDLNIDPTTLLKKKVETPPAGPPAGGFPPGGGNFPPELLRQLQQQQPPQ